jgi:hypothetical protein
MNGSSEVDERDNVNAFPASRKPRKRLSLRVVLWLSSISEASVGWVARRVMRPESARARSDET